MAQDLQSRQKRAFELHAQIASAGKEVVESFLEIGLALKEIRDEKYYMELGYTSFKSYTETEWNIEERTAYRYIEVIEKLPAQILTRVSVKSLEIPSLRRLLALPFDNPEEFALAISEQDLPRLARMSDDEFQTALEEMEKDRDGWHARYQKVYREKQVLSEQLATLNAEKESLLKEVNRLTEELTTARAEEKTEKVLKLQQQIEDWKKKFTELYEKYHALESEKYTFEQAVSVIKKSFEQILSALLDLKKIDVVPALIPQVYAEYTLVRDMVDAELTYLASKIDIAEGPATMRDLTEEVRRLEAKGIQVKKMSEQ